MNKITTCATLIIGFTFLIFSSAAYAIGICNSPASATEAIDSIKLSFAGKLNEGAALKLLRAPPRLCSAFPDCHVPKAPSFQPGSVGVELAHQEYWVCVAVPGKRPLDVWYGWIPEHRWQREPVDSTTSLDRWLGVWQNYGAKIWISSHGAGALSVRGDGIYDNGGPGGPHFGDVAFEGIPSAGFLSNAVDPGDEQCSIALRLTGDFLVATDNGHCGALNVSFDGVYRLRHRLH